MTLPTLRRGGSIPAPRHNDNNTNLVNRIDPWSDLSTMDRVFDNFFRNPIYLVDRSGNRASSDTAAQIELYETPEEVVAYIYASGLDASTLDISATSEQLSVRGERKPRLTVTEGTVSHTPWLSIATTSGTISASYSLPIQIDPEKVRANYKDGILEIHMAKHEAAKPRQIKVHVTES